MEKVWHARAERQTRKMQQTYWYATESRYFGINLLLESYSISWYR